MNTKVCLAGAVVAIGLVSQSMGSILSITDNPISVNGVVGTDYLLYTQSGSVLTVNNAVTPSSVLSGPKAQNAPGGCIRLYAGSDTASLASFQTATHIGITGTLGGHAITVTSLNGNDWFTTPTGYNTSYGVSDLANTWFNTFLTTYNFSGILTTDGFSASAIAAEKTFLFNSFVNNPPSNGDGFQHVSGTTVSYVHEDTSTGAIQVGVADTDGFLINEIDSFVSSQPGGSTLLPLLPADVYASKAVLVSIDGGTPQALYTFGNQLPSGLHTSDSTESFNLEYQVSTSVPEPASATLFAIGGGLLLRRRRGRYLSPTL